MCCSVTSRCFLRTPITINGCWHTDHDEARQVLKGHLKEKSLEELYDSVLIPALTMAEQDRHRNDLDEETATFIYQSTREFVEDLSENGERDLIATTNSAAKGSFVERRASDLRSRERRSRRNCRASCWRSCWASRDTRCTAFPIGTRGGDAGRKWRTRQSSIICISAIPPLALTHARQFMSACERKFPSQPIIVGLWNYSGDAARSASRIDTPERVHVLTTLAEAVLQVRIQAELAVRAAQQRAASKLPSVHASD